MYIRVGDVFRIVAPETNRESLVVTMRSEFSKVATSFYTEQELLKAIEWCNPPYPPPTSHLISFADIEELFESRQAELKAALEKLKTAQKEDVKNFPLLQGEFIDGKTKTRFADGKGTRVPYTKMQKIKARLGF